MFNRIGSFSFDSRFYDAPDSGSGGGFDGGDPSGAAPTGGADPSAPAEPTVYEVDDDTLIKPRGSDKPVKYGEHFRGFQSQFTKASQKAAQLERQLQERDNQLRQIQTQQQAERQRQSQPQGDQYGDLRQAPYLSGQDAVSQFERIDQGLQTRDKISLAIVNRLQQLEKTLSGLNESHVGSQFNGKIQRWVEELGLPAEANDLAKEIYLAYEGDDLDAEFPTILRNRWDQMVRLFQQQQQQKVAANRKPPFLPGRGGQTGPSKPLQLDPRLSATETAEQLFHLFSEGEQT